MNLNSMTVASHAARLAIATMLVGVTAISLAAPDSAPAKTKLPQTVPATTPPGTVTLDKMDDATQQNLGRGAVNTPPGNPAKPVSGSDVRDWAGIDTNSDHSISPGEMEIFLAAAHARPSSKPAGK